METIIERNKKTYLIRTDIRRNAKVLVTFCRMDVYTGIKRIFYGKMEKQWWTQTSVGINYIDYSVGKLDEELNKYIKKLEEVDNRFYELSKKDLEIELKLK